MSLESGKLKQDFPALQQKIGEQPLTYLDTAASSLKPLAVIERMNKFYSHETANVHRGAHHLSDQATSSYEQARTLVRAFINAKHDQEIVSTRGTTESINLVASSYGESFLNPGETILITQMEHHSNIVPWYLLAQKKKCKLVYVKVTDKGAIDIEDYKQCLRRENVKIVAFSSCSNAMGTINPVKELTALAHQAGAVVVVDAAQSVSAQRVDVQDWGCDFLAFSGHKLFAPFGVGILYGKKDLLNQMPPYQGGGSMIDAVTEESISFLESPQRFEAGTPNVAGMIGLGEAIRYVTALGLDNIQKHEKETLKYAVEKLSQLPNIQFLGDPSLSLNICSFYFADIHHSDLASIIDKQGVALRAGHLCCQPLMQRFGITGTLRASFSIYNDQDDVDRLYAAVKKAKEFF